MSLQEVSQEILARLKFLNASTDDNPYSGLSVEIVNGQIKIFDDYDSAVLSDPKKTLEALQELDPIDLGSADAFQSVWDAISAHGERVS